MKDMIKSGGEWISSLELENIMSRHEAVLESAAVGIPDSRWGERPLMLIVLNARMRGLVDEQSLQAHMTAAAADGRLPKFAVPERYIIVDELPKTSVGKLDKKRIRREYS